MKNRPHPALLNSVAAAAIAASALNPLAPAAAQETITPIINPTIESTTPLATLQHPPRYTLRPGEKPLNILVFDYATPLEDTNYSHGPGFVIPAIMRTLGAPGDGLYRVTFYNIKGGKLNASIQSALAQNETITAANFSLGWDFEYGAMSRILSEYNQESTTVTKDNLAEHSSTILRLIKDGNVAQYRQMLQSYYQENGLSPKDAKKRVDTDLYALKATKETIPLLIELADSANVGVFISTGNFDSAKKFALYNIIPHPKIFNVGARVRSIEPQVAFPQIAHQTALNTAATFLISAVSGHFTPFAIQQKIPTEGFLDSNTTTLADSYFQPTTEPRVFTAHQQQLLQRALATSQTNNALFATPAEIQAFRQNNIIFSALSVTPNAPEAEKLYPLKDAMDLMALTPQLRADLAAIAQQPHKTYVLYDNNSGSFLRSDNAPVLFSQADDGSLRASTLPTWGGTSLATPTAMAREAIVRKLIPTDLHTALHYAAATNSTLDIRRPLIEQPVGNLATYLHALKNGQQQR